MTKILYIAGCGRSGSTLLERVLNSHENLFATGELCFFLDSVEFDPESSQYQLKTLDCNFWSKVTKEFFAELGDCDLPSLRKTQLSFESILGFINCLSSSISKQKILYREFNSKLLATINRNISQQNEYLIDSSKTARLAFWRPIALSKVAGFDVKIIHLVRDGRGCIWSYLKGSNRKMEQGLDARIPFAALRCSLTWFLAQTAAHLCQFVSDSDCYLRVRYEDFVENPESTLQTIGLFLGVDFSTQVQMLKNGYDIPLADQLVGNRVRNQSQIILKKDIAWKTRLSWYYQLLFWLIDWPYALLYGYRWGKNPNP